MNKYLLAVCLSMSCAVSAPANDSTKVDYIPKIGGAIRTRWEIETADGDNRFLVRNARVRVHGNIAAPIQYYVQADLCNQGKMQFLDAWVRLSAFSGFKVKAGQFRVPFGVDPFKSPGTYIFADRSFIGRDIANMRAVGAQISYEVPKTPLSVEAGVFSPGQISDHSNWSNKMTFAAKAVLNAKPFTITAGYETMSPDSVRINMADAAITFTQGQLTAEAEYMYKHYTNHTFKACHSYNVWVDYGIPLRKGLFKRLSFQGRVDGSTAHSNGSRDATGVLTADQPYRNRLTAGVTLSYLKKPLKCELQLNYEKYFYHSGYEAPQGRDDKIVAELIVVF